MMLDYQNELALIKDTLKKNTGGMSVTEIAKALGKSKNTVGRYLDILLITGQVDMRAYGMAKVFTISQRMPLSAMLSYAKELIMVVDEDLRIVDVNENFLSLLHLSRDDVVGKTVAHVQAPDVDVHELLERITGGEDETDPVTFRLKGKGERIFHRKQIPAVFDDGSKGITIILEDVTAHVLAEREIRESEERFRMMAENIRDGIIIREHNSVVFANSRIAEITGYPLDELLKMDPLAIIAPEDRAVIKKQLRDLDPASPQPGDILVWIERKDGARRFVYIRSTVLKSKKTYQFIIMTDITDIKSKETELALSEQRFRMMAENIHDGIFIVEQDRIVFANRRISEITGYSDDELKEMGFYEPHVRGVRTIPGEKTPQLIPESEQGAIKKIIGAVQPDSGNPAEFKVWINRKDGTRRFIHGKATAASHDHSLSIYIIITDITEFAEKEKVLRERIESLQELLT
jgi:PAS domain S-box-containing protein